MKSVMEYVDELKEKLEIESDAELGKRIGGNRNTVSSWRNRGSQPEDFYCIVMAELLGIHPLEIIAAANIEREKDPQKIEWWEDFSKRHGYKVLSVSLIAGSLSLQNNSLYLLENVTRLYIMLSKRRDRTLKKICYKVSPSRNNAAFLRPHDPKITPNAKR